MRLGETRQTGSGIETAALNTSLYQEALYGSVFETQKLPT